ncbi:MAG: family 1 glycosylhydrolase [Propionibacteriaceae bacterium]|jgi:beta-glucosidase/6-phospho-beta-glucosidase/beta-galactosidase|nr:family 1 glycosylhydrolase [Propionibacteriaceae bacterium]
MRWYQDGRLHFALGLEDTFIPQTRPGERALDEYELTQHYDHWHEDLGLAAESGATMLRWGVPWHRVNPAPDGWDCSWLDRVVDRFDQVGVTPIIDLMHYGTPLWLERQFAHPDYPARVAEYAARLADRYRGRLNCFTPLNEPLLNAIYCGQFAHWPPYLSSDEGLVTLIRALTRGIVATQRAIAEVAGDEVTFIHVEASFRFAGEVAANQAEVDHLRNRAFVMEDLVTGRVGDDHPLAPYLLRHGFSDDDLDWARRNTAWPDVMGVNYYPAGQTEIFEVQERHSGGPLDPRPRRNDWTTGLTEVLTAWAERYGRPVMLTETAITGSDAIRQAWLDDSVAAVHGLRAEGVDVVGYTWWSLIDMIEWTYRQGTQPPSHYQLNMGLWRLEADATGAMRRVRTPLADQFRRHALAARGDGNGV